MDADEARRRDEEARRRDWECSRPARRPEAIHADGGLRDTRIDSLMTYACPCGAIFRAESSEDLLETVDAHAEVEHPPASAPDIGAAEERLPSEVVAVPADHTNAIRTFLVATMKGVARDERTKVLLARAGKAVIGALAAGRASRRGQTPSEAASRDLSPGSAPESDDDTTDNSSPYPTAPRPLQLTMQGAGQLVQHVALSDLWVEVTMTGFSQFALAIEWRNRTPRIFYPASAIPSSWTAVRHDDFAIPLELKRVGQTTVMCRWLEPSREDLREQLAMPSAPAVDPGAVERRIRTGLDHIGDTGSQFHV